MITILAISEVEDLLVAINSLPDSSVIRPLPTVRVGAEGSWEDIRIVHWDVPTEEPRLRCRGTVQTGEDGQTFRDEWSARRGYGIPLRDGGWAILVVDADAEMYEEAVDLVECVRPGELL